MNEANDSQFMTRKWNILNDLSKANYNVGNQIIYNREVLKFNLCDYNGVYILVSGGITVIGSQATQVASKNYASLTKCTRKIDGTTTGDGEDLYLVMPMNDLIE